MNPVDHDYHTQVTYDGETYPSALHALGAARTLREWDRMTVRLAPFDEVRNVMKGVKKRDDWDLAKHDAALQIIRQKFMNPFLVEKLIQVELKEVIDDVDESRSLLDKALLIVKAEIQTEWNFQRQDGLT